MTYLSICDLQRLSHWLSHVTSTCDLEVTYVPVSYHVPSPAPTLSLNFGCKTFFGVKLWLKIMWFLLVRKTHKFSFLIDLNYRYKLYMQLVQLNICIWVNIYRICYLLHWKVWNIIRGRKSKLWMVWLFLPSTAHLWNSFFFLCKFQPLDQEPDSSGRVLWVLLHQQLLNDISLPLDLMPSYTTSLKKK